MPNENMDRVKRIHEIYTEERATTEAIRRAFGGVMDAQVEKYMLSLQAEAVRTRVAAMDRESQPEERMSEEFIRTEAVTGGVAFFMGYPVNRLDRESLMAIISHMGRTITHISGMKLFGV